MSDKTFRILLLTLTAVGIIATVALLCYTAYLYDNCSIISFIANGR